MTIEQFFQRSGSNGYVIICDSSGDPISSLQVKGSLITVAAEYTIVGGATAYSRYDLVGSNPMALLRLQNIFRELGGTGYLTGLQLNINKKSLTPQFRIHLYNVSTPTLAVDNAAWIDKYVDQGKRLGWYDMPACTTAADTTNSDCSRALAVDLRHRVWADATDNSLYIGFESIGAADVTFDAGQKIRLTATVDNN